MDKKLDELLEQLKDDTSLTETKQEKNQRKEPNVDDNTINEYILQKAGKLVNSGVDTVEALKEVILQSGEPHDISAYSEMYRAVVGALDTMTKINIQNKRAKTSKELKEMEIKSRSELPQGKSGDTNILIATREEIIQNFLEAGKKVINADCEEVEEAEESEPINGPEENSEE